MKYIYHVNGEAREPTAEEWRIMAEQSLMAAGLRPTTERRHDDSRRNENRKCKSNNP